VSGYATVMTCLPESPRARAACLTDRLGWLDRMPARARLRRYHPYDAAHEWGPIMEQLIHPAMHHVSWNKGKLVGQKAPLKPKDLWAIRVRRWRGSEAGAVIQARRLRRHGPIT
jgi:hypothetical protein